VAKIFAFPDKIGAGFGVPDGMGAGLCGERKRKTKSKKRKIRFPSLFVLSLSFTSSVAIRGYLWLKYFSKSA